LFKSVVLQNKNREVGSIMGESDLSLMLLRHWTLYDSLSNTNYVVSQLKLWTEPGQTKLMRFLAYIGIPLEQAK